MDDLPTLSARLSGSGKARAPASHHEQLAVLDFALNHVREAVYLTDAEGRIRYVNAESCRALGYSREELLRLCVPDIGPEYPPERWREHWRELTACGSLTFESTHRTRDGREFPVEITANYFEYGGTGYNLALVRDLTPLRNSERQLRALHEVIMELSRVDASDALCRRAVELGRTRLEFERIGLWFIDESASLMIGTYGTDERGALRDERDARVPLEPHGATLEVFSRKQPVARMRRGPLRNEANEPVGEGENAVAALWDGDHVIGVLTVDNLFSGQPFTERQLEILRFYATAVGHLITRKRAEEALRKAEHDFRTLAENSPDIIIRYDRDVRRTYVNPVYERDVGLARTAAVGAQPTSGPYWRANVSLDDYRACIRGVLITGKSSEMTLQWSDPAGGPLIYSLRFAPEFNDAGEVVGCLAVGRNINDLVEMERQLATLLENMPDLVLRADLEGRIEYLNPAAARALRLGRGEFDETTWWEALAQRRAEPEALDWARMMDALRDGRSASCLCTLDTVEGARTFDLRFVPERDPAARVVNILGIGRDITEQQHSEQALRRQLRMNEALFSQAISPFVLLDPGGRFLRVNEAWAHHFQLTPADFVGRTFLEMFPSDPNKDAHGILDLVVQSRRPLHLAGAPFEFVNQPERGPTYWDIIVQPIFDDRDEVEFVFFSSIDVTQRKKAEDEVRRLNAELEERIAVRTEQLRAANRDLESFCYSVSHDLRAPLRSIDGFSRILLEDYADRLDEEGRDNLQRVRRASVRMDKLIDDLLALSRTARVALRRTSVDLTTLAGEIAAELQATAPERDVNWRIASGLAAMGDRALLRIVMENLLGNAWKFTSRRARAHIEVGRVESPQGPAFFVRDDGAGFDMAHAANLFGAFRRLHTLEEFPGTGIGLATVKRIVDRHGGRIWAEGQLNVGATFFFTLSPAAEAP